MTSSLILRSLAAAACLAAASSACAHVSLPPGGAAAGSDYEAAFRVGHACKDANATTGLRIELPKGFKLQDAQGRPGWTLVTRPAIAPSGGSKDPFDGGSVSWRSDSAQSALPGDQKAEFIVRGKLTATPGVLYFKVLQSCDKGSADWAQLPVPGADGKPAFPAARLEVLAPGIAAVDVRNAWVRQTVPGQSGTGAFMTLNAPSGARLVGVSTPVAGVSEVHEMTMQGDTLRMREVQGGLALPPRQAVELKPSGYHVMLMDLKRPMAKGTTVPMTLHFQDLKGVASTRELQVPVGAPEGAATAGGHMH